MTTTKRTVTYRLTYTYPTCYDDGGTGHDTYWGDSTETLIATSDREAQLASLDDKYRRPEHCYHGRRSHPVKITKVVVEETADGFSRRTETIVPLPQAKQCACGKTYWPVKGETACHKVVEVS